MELSVCQGWDGAGRADDLGEMKWQTACSPGLGPKGRGDLREVAAEFQLAAAGPVEAVEGSLHQGRHDAAQAGLICTAVPLTVMLHAEPRGLGDDRGERRVMAREPTPEKTGRWASNGRPCPDRASGHLLDAVSPPCCAEGHPSG